MISKHKNNNNTGLNRVETYNTIELRRLKPFPGAVLINKIAQNTSSNVQCYNAAMLYTYTVHRNI